MAAKFKDHMTKTIKIISFIVIVQLIIACNKTDSDLYSPPGSHECSLTEIGYNPPDWSEYYSFNDNGNLIRHNSETRYYCSAKFIYNSDNQIVQSINFWANGYSIVDSITYIYDEDALIKKTTKHFGGQTLLFTREELYQYEAGNDKIKTTKFLNNQIEGSQERLYENNKLVKLTEFDINNAELEKFEIDYDTAKHSINILKNGQQYREILCDFKNCPEKGLNIYDKKNIRIGIDYQPFIFFHEYSFLKGFLLTYQNPIKISEENNITIYSYSYNKYDYPVKRRADKPIPGWDTNYELSYSYNYNN